MTKRWKSWCPQLQRCPECSIKLGGTKGRNGQREGSKKSAAEALWSPPERQGQLCCVAGCAFGHRDRQPEGDVYAVLRSALLLENQQNRAGK